VSCASRLEIQSRPNGWQAQVATMTAGLKSTHIILYCNSGVRAEAAKMVLEVQGYTAVTNGGSYADRGMMENECAACAMGGKAAAGGGAPPAAGTLGDDISFDFSKTVKQAHPGNGMELLKSQWPSMFTFSSRDTLTFEGLC
jgi:rhodanese-related sulfurtransferase